VKTKFSFVALWILLGIPGANAQQYSIDWKKIAGGGASSNGNYSVSGTIGQHDAGVQQMSGGNFSLTGGFWSLISAVQTPGAPNLTIVFISPNSVKILWPATGSYTLQTNNNLAAPNWVGYGGNISNNNGTNSVSISSPAGNLFFRLKNP
jgi:hypothetical protein